MSLIDSDISKQASCPVPSRFPRKTLYSSLSRNESDVARKQSHKIHPIGHTDAKPRHHRIDQHGPSRRKIVIQKLRSIEVGNIWHDDRVLSCLFGHLSPQQVISCSGVCKKWWDILTASHFHDVHLVIDFKKIQLSSEAAIEERLRAAYKWNITSLTFIRLKNENLPLLTRAFIATFRDFFPGCLIYVPDTLEGGFKSVPDSLRNSVISTAHHSSTCLAGSQNFGCLRRLDSAPIKVNLHSARHINQLRFDNCPVSDWALDQLMDVMHTVTRLAVVGCNCLTEVALWSCLRPWITHLEVRDCLYFGDDSVHAIVQGAPCLQELRIQIYHLSDLALSYFTARRLPTLRVLQVDYGQTITSTGINSLAVSLASLQQLRLTGCSKLDDHSVQLICESLLFLQLLEISSNTVITDASLMSIAGHLKQLGELRLDRCVNLTDGGVKMLSGAPHLRLLTLRWCPDLRDPSLCHLGSLRRLEWLSLAGCTGFTQNGLMELKNSRSLRRLELVNVKTTNDIRRLLRNEMPRCFIFF